MLYKLILFLVLTAGILYVFGCSNNTPGGSMPTAPSEPVLSISTDILDFGSAGIERELVISNTGGDTLQWLFLSYPNWINVTLDSGYVMPAASAAVFFNLDRSQLDIGPNEGEISLTSNAGDLTLPVFAQMSEESVLGELPDTLDFGFYDEDFQISIYNAGQDTLVWWASTDDDLFSVSPDSGTTISESQISVNFDRSNAPETEILATLIVSTVSESRQTVLLADNGDIEGGWLSHCATSSGIYTATAFDWFYIVRFDRPPGWSDYSIDSVAVNLYTIPNAWDDIQFSCWGTFVDILGYVWPDLNVAYYQTPPLNPISGWSIWSVDWPLDLETFAIGYLQHNYIPIIFPNPYYDNTQGGSYSYLAWEETPGYLSVEFIPTWEWCIEVYVEPVGPVSSTTGSQSRWLRPTSIEPLRTSPSFEIHQVLPVRRDFR
jgi:hypothetical protein